MDSERKISLDRDKWPTKLFLWSLEIWNRFVVGWDTPEEILVRGTNLCRFVRATFVLMPLVFLAHAALFVGIVFAFWIIPARLFGWEGSTITMGVVTLIVVLTVIGAQAVKTREETQRRQAEVVSAVPVKRKKAGSELWKLVLMWFRSKKKKICPLIEFHSIVEEGE